MDSLAEQFSFTDKKINESSKIPFNKTKICSAIFVPVRRLFQEATDDEIRGIMSSWLQQAKTRQNRRNHRNELSRN
ncbi:hypothetical protein RN001_006289 [Aquatica leii]|uniref:Uncharacterized protein n=1 Tax=Aquatica leii TaxID=1421715 RepID=A0AAN7P7Q6_9COLE|nr:hypothetical protein RN001_006289 [Aquatica leii]